MNNLKFTLANSYFLNENETTLLVKEHVRDHQGNFLYFENSTEILDLLYENASLILRQQN